MFDKTFERVALDYYESHIEEYRDKIIAFLEGKNKTEEVERNRNRIHEELCEQYFHKMDADALYALVSDFKVFLYLKYKRASSMVSIGGAKQIYRYWEWLYSVSPNKFNLNVYLHAAESSPELFLKQVPELTDTAMHINDSLGVLRFVLKAVDLFRYGYGLNEEEAKFFAGDLSVAAFAANAYGLVHISHNLLRAQKRFLERGTLPNQHTQWERALRTFIQAESSKEVDEKVEGLEAAVSLLEGSKSYFRDCYVMKYQLVCAEMEAGFFEQAETNIEFLLNKMDDYDTRKYDDRWECFKAEVLGQRVFVKKALGELEEALESCERTICRWEVIEDWRIENGDNRATIDTVQYYSNVYDEIEGILNDKNLKRIYPLRNNEE